MNRHRRSAVALRHVAFEDLGLFASVLDREGWDVSFCDAAVEDISHKSIQDAELLIVLGGPIGAHETESYPFLGREMVLLERRLARDLPTLGICLGSQLMAKALGSHVFAGKIKEIGWGRVELTEAGANSCLGVLSNDGAAVLHWHGDSFDLPSGALRLASNSSYENQAFSYGHKALALQFHLEADPRQLEEWYVGHAVELAVAGISVKDLRAATSKVASVLASQADSIFTCWLREVG
jgi:GMP synthase (glutamine-hydrolysing)